MAITRALEFDQTPNKLLFQIAENARAQELADQKLQLDEQRKRNEVLQQINPATLYSTFEKEVVSRSLSDLTNQTAQYLKTNPNASAADLRMFLNKNISGLAQQSAKIKAVKDNVDKTISGLGKDSIYDTPTLRALAIDRGIYKTNELGQKVLKNPDEIDEAEDFLSVLTKEAPDQVISKVAGAKTLEAKIKSAPLFEENVMSERDTPDGRQTVVVGTKSKMPFYLQAENGKVGIKKGKNGVIDETVFNDFYSDPATAVYINGEAKKIMKQAGIPETADNFEVYKRTFLTDYLERNKKGVIDKVDKKLYAIPRAAGSGGGTEKEPPITVDVFSAAQKVIDSGQQVRQTKGGKVLQSYGSPLSAVDQAAKDIMLADVNRVAKFQPTPEDTPRDYTQDDIVMRPMDEMNIGLYEYPSGKFLTKFNQTEANAKASKAAGGLKSAAQSRKQESATSAQPAAKPKKESVYLINGKQYSKADLNKLGYNDDQINQALSLGNIKQK
jgi:hypothetical protein